MANSDKLFVIAIGGTGMRCLESFTHLCAMGIFDSKEIDILTLDTDQTNGNKQRTEELIKQYNRIKTTSSTQGGSPNKDSFFSAKLNLYRFWTDYNSASRTKFKNIAQLSNDTPEQENKLLSELFLDDNVQEFNLAHGYRAQTHLGSYLMYHAIVEAARNLESGKNQESQEKEFGEFIQKIYDAGDEARVFVFGSIFGGTGASSIPVIPKALNDAIKIRGGDKMGLSKGVKFGSTLLTEYFSFKKPDAAQKQSKENAIIADSSFFTLNSQAALQFYQSDPTVQSTYKKMYHIGWPITSEDFSKNSNEKETITGGQNQKNPNHITELICACAAFDFFNTDSFNNDKAEYVYKSVRYKDGILDFNFNDFIGDGDNGKFFARKFGGFVSFMHLALTINKGSLGDNGVQGFLNRLEKQNIHNYSTLEEQYTVDLNNYLKSFGYSFDNNNFTTGWLYQIKSTVSGKLILNENSYTQSSKELNKLDIGKLFDEKEYHWEKSGLFGNTYEAFVETLIDPEVEPKAEQNCSDTNEKFLAHIYNAVKKSQKI